MRTSRGRQIAPGSHQKRFMPKDCFWFRHDSNARRDRKMLRLRSKHGMEGVGVYWSLLEIMREESDYGIQKDDLDLWSVELGIDPERLTELVETMCETGLFECTPEGGVYSPSFLRRMEQYDEIVERRREAGKRGGRRKKGEKEASAKQKPSKSKASAKQKPSYRIDRIDRIDESRPPNTAVVKALFEEKGLPAAAAAREADKFVNHYKSVGWVVGKSRTPMKDWRAAARGWYARMDNKPAVVNHNNWQ